MIGFIKNTPVLMADGTYKNIQDVHINDHVMSWDEENKCLKEQIVVKTFSDKCDELTLYTFANGNLLYGCENLIFLTSDGWKENIEINDLIVTKDGTTTALIDKEIIGQDTVYELDIEDIDNYIVQNIVVHNAITVGGYLTFTVYDTSGNGVASWSGVKNNGSYSLMVLFNNGYIDVSCNDANVVNILSGAFPLSAAATTYTVYNGNNTLVGTVSQSSTAITYLSSQSTFFD